MSLAKGRTTSMGADQSLMQESANSAIAIFLGLHSAIYMYCCLLLASAFWTTGLSVQLTIFGIRSALLV
jgi:hypothetical protein